MVTTLFGGLSHCGYSKSYAKLKIAAESNNPSVTTGKLGERPSNLVSQPDSHRADRNRTQQGPQTAAEIAVWGFLLSGAVILPRARQRSRGLNSRPHSDNRLCDCLPKLLFLLELASRNWAATCP